MLNIAKLVILISTFLISNTYSFELGVGLWHGSTYTYTRNYKNKFDFTKPIINTYNYSRNFNISFDKNYYYSTNENYRLKLQSYKKQGGVMVNTNKNTYRKTFNNQIIFIHNNTRSIINVNYYNNKLNYISLSKLRSDLNKNNINNPISKIKTLRFYKTTNIKSSNIYHTFISKTDLFDYEKDHISNVFIDNMVISVPEIINDKDKDNKPVSMLFGCLLSDECYKQLTLNYNFNGYLVFTDFVFNEYEPLKS
jgi:hypothetical protein